MVVTIGRQFGSGGRRIGKALAEKLGIPFYDKKLITLVAQKSGLDPDFVRSIDEKATNSLLYSLSIGAAATLENGFRLDPQIPMNDRLFLLQHDIIRQISADPCVIVGRCSDYILRDREDCLRVFIYADMEKREEYAKKHYKIPDNKVSSVIHKTDKSRANYYNYYSSGKWGFPENYDLCINSGTLGAKGTVELIEFCLQERGMI